MRLPSALPLLSVLSLASMGLPACSADVVAAGSDANTSSTHALLVVEQTVPVDSQETTISHASMWFMRVADEQSLEAATRLVTDVVEVPAFGRCVGLSEHRAQAVAPTLGPIELLHAGDVNVATASSRVQLAVRAFPDVANLVSGVMYTAPGLTDLTLPIGGPLSVQTTGGDGIGAMQATTHAPAPPNAVHVDGLPIDSPDLEVKRGHSMIVTWAPESPSDMIYIDVDPVPGSPSDRVRCAVVDRGASAIPSNAIPETPMLALSVHRVRMVSLQTPSGDVGTAHFDVAQTARVKVAAP